MILRRREQLLRWLEQNAPTAYMRRAVGEGNVEFLGMFQKIPGSKFPGWIVQTTSSITGKKWNIVVRKWNLLPNGYYVWVLDKNRSIPWQHWNPSDSMNPFFYGDNSETYRQNRTSAETQRCREVHQEDTST